MTGHATLTLFLELYGSVKTVLDVGCGQGTHAARMRDRGMIVTTLDLLDTDAADIMGDYMDNAVLQHEALWCCHALEHQIRPWEWLRKFHGDLGKGGVLALVLPNEGYRDKPPTGHVMAWTPRHTIYMLALAGFDCSRAILIVENEEFGILCRKSTHEPEKLGPPVADFIDLRHRLPDWFSSECEAR